MDELQIDQSKQIQAKEYARIHRRLMLVELVIGGLFATSWLVFGWGINLSGRIEQFYNNLWLEPAVFAFVFSGIYLLIDIPLSFYSGFTLPHRYNLSNQKLQGWIGDLVKGLALGGIFGLLIIEVIYWLLRTLPEYWWVIAGFFIFAINIVLANVAPVLLMPLFFKFTPLGVEYGELSERLVRLAERAGTRVRGVFQIDMSRRTKTANAALTGLGNTRRIILGDTLLSEFTTDEIETVFAHELGHQVHKDIPLGIAVETLLTFAGLFLANLGLNWGVAFFGFESLGDAATMPLLVLVMGGYGLLTMPLGNSFSRWRERRADAYALQVTGNGTAYASALIRLANQNLAETEPEAWVELLLYSHPALGKRIDVARRFKQEQAA
ncbi:MAG: hypothetical protein A2Z16_17285 [Chloroflexi bacterium RBG_16_54_18]|nr:MAG: hypothetical protein A2Z16_17285 [Chloroflexi bacterium RBG_16_54_18]